MRLFQPPAAPASTQALVVRPKVGDDVFFDDGLYPERRVLEDGTEELGNPHIRHGHFQYDDPDDPEAVVLLVQDPPPPLGIATLFSIHRSKIVRVIDIEE